MFSKSKFVLDCEMFGLLLLEQQKKLGQITPWKV